MSASMSPDFLRKYLLKLDAGQKFATFLFSKKC